MLKNSFILLVIFLVLSGVSEAKTSLTLKKAIIATAIAIPVSWLGFKVYKSLSRKESSETAITHEEIPARELPQAAKADEAPRNYVVAGARKSDRKFELTESPSSIKNEHSADEGDLSSKLDFREFKNEFNGKVQALVKKEMPLNASQAMRENFEKSVVRLADDIFYRELQKIDGSKESDRVALMDSYVNEINTSALNYRELINEGEKLKLDAEKAEKSYLAMASDKAVGKFSKEQVDKAHQLFLETGRRSSNFQMEFAATTINDKAAQQRLMDRIITYEANPAETTNLLTETVTAENIFKAHKSSV